MKFPKFEYVRSKKLMDAYRMIPCQHCGIDDGSVCGCHSNWSKHGKGRGIKASDEYCASLCGLCHFMLDRGASLTADERWDMWFKAHVKTVRELTARGLWPKGVPVPDVSEHEWCES